MASKKRTPTLLSQIRQELVKNGIKELPAMKVEPLGDGYIVVVQNSAVFRGSQEDILKDVVAFMMSKRMVIHSTVAYALLQLNTEPRIDYILNNNPSDNCTVQQWPVRFFTYDKSLRMLIEIPHTSSGFRVHLIDETDQYKTVFHSDCSNKCAEQLASYVRELFYPSKINSSDVEVVRLRTKVSVLEQQVKTLEEQIEDMQNSISDLRTDLRCMNEYAK